MTLHKGWRVRPVRKSWVGLVAVGKGVERSRSFKGSTAKRDAERWAKDQAAKLRLGLVAKGVHRGATRILVEDYLAELKELGRTAGYRDDLERLFERLAEAAPDLGAPAAEDLVGKFLAGLRRTPGGRKGASEAGIGRGEANPAAELPPVAPKTRNTYLVAIRGLCAWAIGRGRLGEDPTRNIRKATEPEYLRPQFAIAELRAMAQAVDHPYHLRFVVGFYLGLRSDEVAHLRWPDLDIEGRVWAVTGKGTKQRLAHVPEEALPLLALHAATRTDDYVCTVRQQLAHGSQHRRDLHALCRACGFDPAKRSPHSLRHSHAGIMTATGQPSLLLAAHLGHVDAQTTALYVKMAMRYTAAVQGWPRAQIALLAGWNLPWRPVNGMRLASAG